MLYAQARQGPEDKAKAASNVGYTMAGTYRKRKRT